MIQFATDEVLESIVNNVRQKHHSEIFELLEDNDMSVIKDMLSNTIKSINQTPEQAQTTLIVALVLSWLHIKALTKKIAT